MELSLLLIIKKLKPDTETYIAGWGTTENGVLPNGLLETSVPYGNRTS